MQHRIRLFGAGITPIGLLLLGLLVEGVLMLMRNGRLSLHLDRADAAAHT